RGRCDILRSRATSQLRRRNRRHEIRNAAGHSSGVGRSRRWRGAMKLQPLGALPAIVRGKKVVLANGCFDILHVGHLRYLKGAKELGDVLVVAMNSDVSMRLIKDSGRPILTENERVQLVSALRCVDYIVLFDEPDVGRVLDVLRPAIHAKG